MAAEDHATISDRPPAQHVVVAPERDPISGRTSPGDRSNKDNRTDEALRPRSRAKSLRSPALVAAGALVVLASVGAIVAAATGADRDASRPGVTDVEGGAAGSSSPGDQTDTTGTALTTTALTTTSPAQPPTQPPGGFYGIDVVVGSFYNPIPSNATPSPTSSGSLPFVGVCDGVGPCAIAGSLDDVLIDIEFALITAMVYLAGVPLTPVGDGAYTYRSSGPYNEFCPIPTEVEFAVQMTATTISGSFSHVPETRGVFVFDDKGSTCWASTYDFTFSGTR